MARASLRIHPPVVTYYFDLCGWFRQTIWNTCATKSVATIDRQLIFTPANPSFCQFFKTQKRDRPLDGSLTFAFSQLMKRKSHAKSSVGAINLKSIAIALCFFSIATSGQAQAQSEKLDPREVAEIIKRVVDQTVPNACLRDWAWRLGSLIFPVDHSASNR